MIGRYRSAWSTHPARGQGVRVAHRVTGTAAEAVGASAPVTRDLQAAPAGVEGHARVAHRVDRRLHRIDDLRVVGVQVARGGQRLRRVERGAPHGLDRGRAARSATGSTNASKRCTPRDPLSERPSQAASAAQASRLTGLLAHVVEGAVGTHHLRGHHPVVVLVATEAARGLLAARGEPVGDVVRHDPGAHGPLAALAADDRGVPLQACLRVRQPVGVVGVHHPVLAHHRGQVPRPEDAGALGVGVGRPRRTTNRRGCRRGPGRPATSLEQPPDRRQAALGQRVRHVRHHRVVGVEHPAVAVGGGGVDPRHPAAGVLAAQQVADPGGLAHARRTCRWCAGARRWRRASPTPTPGSTASGCPASRRRTPRACGRGPR